jgi:hypothetical protein
MDATNIEEAYYRVCGDYMSAWEHKAVCVLVPNDGYELIVKGTKI